LALPNPGILGDNSLVNEDPIQNGEDVLPSKAKRPSRKYPWAILVVIALFVVIPFISWYGTWFGRPLSDAKMTEYLHDQNKPRNVQHALAQLGNRMIDRDTSVQKFYPDILAAATNPQPEVRMTAAWVMGQDNSNEEFHSALRSLLEDESAGVRHNAALELVRFGDSSGRPELVAMLNPYVVRADGSGTVELIVKEPATPVAANAPVARVKQEDGNTIEIRIPEAARVESLTVASGEKVESGREIMTLSPSTEQVWEALRALFLVGLPEDIPHVQRYARPLPSVPDKIQKQATFTVEAIRERASQSH
jgi:HEAT repeats